jgi:hypothetical protein
VYRDHLLSAELRQHETLRQTHGMDPLDDSELAQFRANCYLSSSARVADAMAKATVMRLAGTPSLPTIAPIPHYHLGHNLPGHSDSRNLRPLPPVPLAHPSPTLSASQHSRAPPLAPLLDLPPLLPFSPLIACPPRHSLRCSPLLIYDELSRPSFFSYIHQKWRHAVANMPMLQRKNRLIILSKTA